MFDSHCHLDLPAFDADRDEVLARAHGAGVTDVLVPAIRPSTWSGLAATAAAPGRPRVHIALGFRPQVVPELTDAERAAIAELPGALTAARAVAVGECGLDGATGDHGEQERLLRAQIAIARELRLPLIVHILRAHDDAPRILADARASEVGGLLHSYSGGAALVPVYADLGFHFSLAGPVTWKNARRPIEAARAIPADRLCAETDAPDQAPEPHRGGRCEPAFVADVIAGLAAARGTTVAEMAALTSRNARRVLGV